METDLPTLYPVSKTEIWEGGGGGSGVVIGNDGMGGVGSVMVAEVLSCVLRVDFGLIVVQSERGRICFCSLRKSLFLAFSSQHHVLTYLCVFGISVGILLFYF